MGCEGLLYGRLLPGQHVLWAAVGRGLNSERRLLARLYLWLISCGSITPSTAVSLSLKSLSVYYLLH